MKNKVVSKYLFQKHIKLLAVAYLYALIILVVMPIFFAIISGTFGTFSISNTIENSNVGFITTLILGGMALLSYEDYKFLIQNGISRNTYFKNQISSYGAIILIGAVIDELYYLAMHFFLNGTNFYQGCYSDFISNEFLNEIVGFCYHLLWLVAVVTSALAVGSFLSLFSKRVQRLIIICGFVAMIVLMGIVSSSISTIAVTWIDDFIKFILGYQGQRTVTPVYSMLFFFIWSVIMIGFSHIFYNRKQIKRV
ncbi:hypothetical protein [Lentilactobacillus senioris]|uniref:hypothetical protein n=1 Tax=Lentilactobacillus senioris TaxID=931534 RepID=UPI003D2BB21E